MIVVSTHFPNRRSIILSSSLPANSKNCFPLTEVSFYCISQVNFLTKLVALRPGKTVRAMIKDVMQGKDEGAESSESKKATIGITGRVSFSVS